MSSGNSAATGSGAAGGAAGYGFGVGLASGAAGASTVAQQGQGVAALLVMLAVLCFIFAYCCWGAPFCRSLCRRHCCCRLEDTDSESGGFGPSTSSSAHATANVDQAMLTTPTIILLPHGRMLVVDGTLFTQFQAENTGLDLVELGESVIRAQRNPGVARHQLQNSQGSIIEMDAETPSKDSMGSLGCFPPPTYESIYGKEEPGDMPPSYSDILLHRFANLPFEIEMQDYEHDSKEEIEMRSLENCPHIISNPINQLTYPYAAAYSSQSLPRVHQQHPRNPSLVSNPLDGYYVDNELAGLYRNAQRRRSVTTTTTQHTSDVNSNDENVEIAQQRRNDRRNSTRNNVDSQVVSDNRFDRAWNRASRSQNETMNSLNSARNDSQRIDNDSEDLSLANAIYTRSRRSEGHIEREPVRLHRDGRVSVDQINWNLNNLDVRYLSDDEERAESCRSDTNVDEAGAEDDPSNFQALADIRESRV